jgi:intracellular sulfur oxidation DsrE/DsrF family protein
MRFIMSILAYRSLCLVTLCSSVVPVGQDPPSSLKRAAPIIAHAGVVVVLPKAAEQPRKGTKAILDVTAHAKPDAINPGLERAAKILNLYGVAGLKADDIKLTVVLHGAAVPAVLSDASYKLHLKQESNPNLPLIRALHQAGVEVFVCGQALHEAGYFQADVAEPVVMADAFLTVMINRQNEGYAYIPGQ